MIKVEVKKLNRTWQYSPKPVKMGVRDKEKLSAKLQQFIDESGKIRQRVNRFEVKAGRVYLFHLVEQFGWDNPEVRFRIPLIEGKYAEFPFARITLYDLECKECTADWQRHNGQWIVLHEGSIDECLNYIENDNTFFA
jgi:hypothetical protein